MYTWGKALPFLVYTHIYLWKLLRAFYVLSLTKVILKGWQYGFYIVYGDILCSTVWYNVFFNENIEFAILRFETCRNNRCNCIQWLSDIQTMSLLFLRRREMGSPEHSSHSVLPKMACNKVTKRLVNFISLKSLDFVALYGNCEFSLASIFAARYSIFINEKLVKRKFGNLEKWG